MFVFGMGQVLNLILYIFLLMSLTIVCISLFVDNDIKSVCASELDGVRYPLTDDGRAAAEGDDESPPGKYDTTLTFNSLNEEESWLLAPRSLTAFLPLLCSDAVVVTCMGYRLSSLYRVRSQWAKIMVFLNKVTASC